MVMSAAGVRQADRQNCNAAGYFMERYVYVLNQVSVSLVDVGELDVEAADPAPVLPPRFVRRTHGKQKKRIRSNGEQ